MDRDKLNEIAHYLEGTCHTLHATIEHFELDIDDMELEDQLLDVNTECCKSCGWWHESGDLVDEAGNAGECEQCRETADE